MTATYTSVFDDSVSCVSACQYDPVTKTVSEIEQAENGDDPEVTEANALTDEFVTLPDGTELRADDGVTFDY